MLNNLVEHVQVDLLLALGRLRLYVFREVARNDPIIKVSYNKKSRDAYEKISLPTKDDGGIFIYRCRRFITLSRLSRSMS